MSKSIVLFGSGGEMTIKMKGFFAFMMVSSGQHAETERPMRLLICLGEGYGLAAQHLLKRVDELRGLST